MVVVAVNAFLFSCNVIANTRATPMKIPSIQAPRMTNAIRRFLDVDFLFNDYESYDISYRY